MGELLSRWPLFIGHTRKDQLMAIFKRLGTPTEDTWPGVWTLPEFDDDMKYSNRKPQDLRRFMTQPDDLGHKLLLLMLQYPPYQRISATKALKHEWFMHDPGAECETVLAISHQIRDLLL